MIPIQRRNWLQRLALRIQIAIDIVFQRKRGVVLYLKRKDLQELIKNGDLQKGANIDWVFWGIGLPHAQQFIKCFADNIDETEIICNKAEWEASAIEIIKKEKK